MQINEKTIVQRRRSGLIRMCCVVPVLLFLLFSLCTMPVSAAAVEYEYDRYTYSDFSEAGIIDYHIDGSYQEWGDWSYNRQSSAFPNHFIIQYNDNPDPIGRPITFYIVADISSNFAPGEYLFEFDLSCVDTFFQGWDQIPMLSGESADHYDVTWVDVDNPALTIGPTYVNNEGSIHWNVNVYSKADLISSSVGVPNGGYTNYKFQISIDLDEVTYFDDLLIRVPYNYTGHEQDWTVGSMEMFMSDIVIKSYTDNPAAIKKYEPPVVDGMEEYEIQSGVLDGWVSEQESASEELFGIDLGNMRELGNGMLFVSWLFDEYVFDLQPLQWILRIAVAVGLFGLIFGIGSVAFGGVDTERMRENSFHQKYQTPDDLKYQQWLASRDIFNRR